MEMLDRNGIKNKHIESRTDKFTDLVESPDEALGLLGHAPLQPPFRHPLYVLLFVPLIDWDHLTIGLQFSLCYL